MTIEQKVQWLYDNSGLDGTEEMTMDQQLTELMEDAGYVDDEKEE